jgi:hypothetical protein
MPSAELARCSDVAMVPADQLRSGQLLWATVDSPWVHTTDAAGYLRTIEPIRAMDPTTILSTHLPPAIGRTSQFLEMLTAAPQADPFIGPDQQALEAMLASLDPATADASSADAPIRVSSDVIS